MDSRTFGSDFQPANRRDEDAPRRARSANRERASCRASCFLKNVVQDVLLAVREQEDGVAFSLLPGFVGAHAPVRRHGSVEIFDAVAALETTHLPAVDLEVAEAMKELLPRTLDHDVALATDCAPQHSYGLMNADLVRRKVRNLAFRRRVTQGLGVHREHLLRRLFLRQLSAVVPPEYFDRSTECLIDEIIRV